jgi:endoribonuclease LACTB2
VSGDDAFEIVADGALRVALRTKTLPPFTHTNAYVLAADGVGIVLDPGAGDPEALTALRAALTAAGVDAPKGVLLSHTHPDHVGGVDALRAAWPDLQVWAPAGELGRCKAEWGAIGVRHGRNLTLGGAVLTLVGTPGHALDHVAVWWQAHRLLFAGDLVAGAGSIWVGLPDGDVRAYLESLERAAALDPAVVAPAHGPVRRDGATVLHDARRHRLAREASLLQALQGGPARLGALRSRLYPDLDEAAHDLAERTLLAHLAKLMRDLRVMHVGSDGDGPFTLA